MPTPTPTPQTATDDVPGTTKCKQRVPLDSPMKPHLPLLSQTFLAFSCCIRTELFTSAASSTVVLECSQTFLASFCCIRSCTAGAHQCRCGARAGLRESSWHSDCALDRAGGRKKRRHGGWRQMALILSLMFLFCIKLCALKVLKRIAKLHKHYIPTDFTEFYVSCWLYSN